MFERRPINNLYDAARAGNLEGVKEILEKHKNQDFKLDGAVLLYAIQSGNVSLVAYFKDTHKLIPKSGLMQAIEQAKSLEMVQYLIKTFPSLLHTIDKYVIWAAARTGQLAILKCLLEAVPLFHVDDATLYYAVKGGSLEMSKFLVEDRGLRDVTEALELANKLNKTEISTYLQAILDIRKPNPATSEDCGIMDITEALEFANKLGKTEISTYLQAILDIRKPNPAASVAERSLKNQQTSITKEQEEEIKDFKIGRLKLKELCLANPELALIGLKADASRSRYLLLVNDLHEIACSNEQVAAFMIKCSQLHKRLSRDCLVEVCELYPKVAEQIFKTREIRGKLKPGQFIEIVKKHPNLFDVIFKIDPIMSKLSKQVWLTKLCDINEKITSLIMNDPNLKTKVLVNSNEGKPPIHRQKTTLLCNLLIQQGLEKKPHYQLGDSDFFQAPTKPNNYALKPSFDGESGNQLLFKACRELDIYHAQMAIFEYGADVNAMAPYIKGDTCIYSKESLRFSPLSLVAMHGRHTKLLSARTTNEKACAIAKLLLENGANIDILDNGDMGNSPLHWAIVTHKEKLCQLFITHAIENQKNVINLSNKPAKVSYGTNQPLILALKISSQYFVHNTQNLEISNLLIAAGADVNAVNHNQQSALHWAAMLRLPITFFNLLFERNINYCPDTFGKTPKKLYETELDKKMIDICNFPASFTELGYHIIEWDDAPLRRDLHRDTALRYRNKNCDAKVFNTLKQFDASLATDNFNRSFNSDNINAQDHMERTLLHNAVIYGRKDQIKKLLEKDCDITIKDSAGLTANQLAQKLQKQFMHDVSPKFFSGSVKFIQAKNCAVWKEIETMILEKTYAKLNFIVD